MEDIVTLINQAQAGDSQAYGVIVSRFQNMAYGYAYAILNDFHLAQDAAQEAFIEAYLCLPTLREAFAFPVWFKRIVFKQCDRLIRGKRHATAPLETVAEMASSLPGPSDIAEQHEFSQRVQNAISELPQEQRIVTTLFYISGYSHQEIADFLEVPAKTVKSRLHASRVRLRERMIDMVEDEFRANALPDNFTQETVEKAVAQARELNKEDKYHQAEELLREVLGHVPQHPEALRELNRALAQGRVYRQGRFDLLPEMAEQGKIILQANDDEYINQQLARTLLTIPAMPEAIAFIENWIARKGANVERLGMLSWAKGCVADYDEAEAIWQEVLTLASSAEPDEVIQHIPFITFTLADCFATAKEVQRAQRMVRQAWDLCLGFKSSEWLNWFNGDGDWMTIFSRAELDLREVANAMLAQLDTTTGPEAEAKALSVRSAVDDSDEVAADWLHWVRERIAARQWDMLRDLRLINLARFEAQGRADVAIRLTRAIWELLNQTSEPEAEELVRFWNNRRMNWWGMIAAKDWSAIEEVFRQKSETDGIAETAWQFSYYCALRGTPIPAEVMRAIESMDAEQRGLHIWYAIAREAAAAGDEAKAFDALRKDLSYWTNPPYYAADVWEADTYWGELRNHPEFKAAFDERRRRIGPIHGLLHYFPGW